MADRTAWLRWAFLRYHAGQITAAELAAMVQDHRGAPEVPRGTLMLDTETPLDYT